MKLTPNALYKQSQPSAVYFVHGNEPLFLQEAADFILKQAKSCGFNEREIIDVNSRFNWPSLVEACQSLSLFSDKRIIDVRMNGAKAGKAGSAIIQEIAEKHLHPDIILLIQAGHVEAATLKAKWLKVLLKHGDEVHCKSLYPNEFISFCQGRAKSQGLLFEQDALQCFSEFTCGNLLAAKQAIEQLALLHPNSTITLNQVQDLLSDFSRYTVFALIDEALAGDFKKTNTILNRLKLEGMQPPIILWALQRELLSLTPCAFDLANGQRMNSIMQQYKVWSTRQAITQKALTRVSYDKCLQLVQQCHHLDCIIKGAQPGNVWDALQTLCMELAHE